MHDRFPASDGYHDHPRHELSGAELDDPRFAILRHTHSAAALGHVHIEDYSPTVECQIVSEACDDVIDCVNHIRELVAEADKLSEEPNERQFADACNSLTIVIGELVREVVDYAQPDAGVESF